MRPRIATAACVALLLAASARASAMGAIVSQPAGSSSAVAVRIAVSGAPGRTIRWASVRVRGSAQSFAWLLPARAGGRIDLASDAWLEALEAATAPRVVPPDAPPPCGIPGGDEVEDDFTHAATATPGSLAVAGDRSTLDAALATWGLEVPKAMGPAVDATLASGSAIVALLFASGAGDVVTRTVRVVDDSPESLPLSLAGGESGPLAVTAYAFSSQGASLTPGVAVAMDPSALVWGSDGTSTYAAARDALLESNPGAWLFETGGHGPLFEATTVPGGDTVPSLTATYFFRAASYGDASLAPDTCVKNATTWGTSGATVAAACPAGALAGLGSFGCTEVVGAGEIDPAALRCGGVADDLALALSGLPPASTWITRARTLLAPGAFGVDAVVAGSSTAGPYGPVVSCSGYAEPCSPPPASSSSSGSGGAGGSGGGSSGSGGAGSSGSSSGSNDPSQTDPGGPGSDGTGVAAAAAATEVVSAAAEGCGSSSDGSSGDSCSGSSTSSDGSSSDGGCGGSTDSSSSSGCGGSTDGSSSSSGCSVEPRRRSPVSRFVLLLVAIAAIARRRGAQGVGATSGRKESRNF